MSALLCTLTDRQRQMLIDYASGLLTREIAAKHRIDIRTVEEHLEKVRAKLGGVRLVQAVVIATQAGLIRQAAEASPLDSLDHAERACVIAVAQGLGTKAIARRMRLDQYAVDRMRARIAHKTGGPLVRAVVLATKAGWL
jgi:DNA-binding CsgD family transcriptional regulator